MKALLRKASARTRQALVGAIGRALWSVMAEDAWGWSTQCGYSSESEPS